MTFDLAPSVTPPLALTPHIPPPSPPFCRGAFWSSSALSCRPLLTRPGVKALWFPSWFMSPTTTPHPHPTSSPPGGTVPFQLVPKRGRRGGKKKKWGTTLFPFQENKSHSSLFREWKKRASRKRRRVRCRGEEEFLEGSKPGSASAPTGVGGCFNMLSDRKLR